MLYRLSTPKEIQVDGERKGKGKEATNQMSQFFEGGGERGEVGLWMLDGSPDEKSLRNTGLP